MPKGVVKILCKKPKERKAFRLMLTWSEAHDYVQILPSHWTTRNSRASAPTLAQQPKRPGYTSRSNPPNPRLRMSCKPCDTSTAESARLGLMIFRDGAETRVARHRRGAQPTTVNAQHNTATRWVAVGDRHEHICLKAHTSTTNRGCKGITSTYRGWRALTA
ncbi:hypothetical protein BJY01DRAFT_213796 [Aspergillus pseudoustus]|uniref:Uncharacterized protein n=1 Tax=Aspergillus pseudoustus TaxID=1810923 RepID=A0ABR4K0X8_9EURO